MTKNLLIIFSLLCLGYACNEDAGQSGENTTDANPPAEGFDAENSDEKAIELADAVMKAMGGRRSWDTTRFLHWNFFGRRKLLWDKHLGRVRIESMPDSTIYLVDLKNGGGQVKRGDIVLENLDSLAKYTSRGKSIWNNDAYWLLMPLKLKDSGVTLKYVGQDTTVAGSMAEVLQLTFQGVGDTPQNKYLVYIDPQSKLVTQWDYYADAGDAAPQFSTPWADYQPYGDLLLSGDRGRNRLTEIAVYNQVPEAAFSSFDPVDLPE